MKEQMAHRPQGTGLIFGKFLPLHTGHINMIFEALTQVETLHLFVCSETERDQALYIQSQFQRIPGINERISWMQQTFGHHANIHIHHLNEDGILPYPNGWVLWSQRAQELMRQANIQANCVFSSEPQDVPSYKALFNLPVHLIDPERSAFNISATKIRQQPFRHWAFIPECVRPFFIKTIVIAHNDDQAACVLGNKLAQTFNAQYRPLAPEKMQHNYGDPPKTIHKPTTGAHQVQQHSNKIRLFAFNINMHKIYTSPLWYKASILTLIPLSPEESALFATHPQIFELTEPTYQTATAIIQTLLKD